MIHLLGCADTLHTHTYVQMYHHRIVQQPLLVTSVNHYVIPLSALAIPTILVHFLFLCMYVCR